MKTLNLYRLCLIVITVFLISCSSNNDDDCIKEINQDYVTGINGFAYYYTEKKQVPCNLVSEQTELLDGVRPLLKNFQYNILKFEFNPDIGNNISRLYFEVELKNPNDFEARGVPVFKMKTNGNLDLETTYEPYLNQSCEVINANSSCIVIVEVQGNNSANNPGTIELVDVEYALVRPNR